MSCRAMSCRHVMLETDPCVCPCQYSPTSCQRPEPLPLCKVSISTFLCQSRQSLARKRSKLDQAKCHAPFSASKHVGNDMSFHVVTPCRHDMSCGHDMSCRHNMSKTSIPARMQIEHVHQEYMTSTRPLTPARIRFLILIEFGLTTPNRGMVHPVHAGTQAGGLNYC